MNEIIKKEDKHLIVHQCLFGYQNGHRLIATSLQLPEEAASTLLQVSDLAPGLNLPPNGGYWTGIPLPSANSYALMFTWLAPEMPRPGCVWTQALILNFADIARFPDLSVLAKLTIRPDTKNDLEAYRAPITLASSTGSQNLGQQTESLDRALVTKVIRAIYAKRGTGIVTSPLGKMDEIIFSVWSQQWPRLRRSFSFRTAASINDGLSNTRRYDLLIVLAPNWDHFNLANNETGCVEDWEKTCIDDLLTPHSTELRRFLWRYGSDVRQGRKRFEFLVDVYISTRSKRLSGRNLHKVLTAISQNLVAPDDGKVLKEDLVGKNQYSLLPPADFLDMFSFYLNDPVVSNLPAPTAVNIMESLQLSWPGRTEKILSLAETVSTHDTALGTQIFNWLAVIIGESTFFPSTKTRPNLRSKLLTLKPALLDCDDLIEFQGAELLNFVKYLPDDNQVLIARILSRLINVDDIHLALEMVRRFPSLVIETFFSVIESYESSFAIEGKIVPQSWINAISEQSFMVIKSGYIERAMKTSTLSFVASMIGYIQPVTLQYGPLPWAKGIINARDDLRGFERKKFLVFLLELALQNPVAGCEPLFEIAFEPVHSDLHHSKLCDEQSSQLLSLLPNLGWLKNWDNCLRLRLAIVDAYVTHDLAIESFKQLTKDNNLINDLISIAKNTNDGKKFIKQMLK